MSRLSSNVLTVQVALGCFLFAVSSAFRAPVHAQVSAGSHGNFRIAGTIVSAGEGHPLARARVSLEEIKNPQNQVFMITKDDGRFEFANLGAGKYSLTGARRGYITATYDQHEQFSTAIVTGAGVDTENLRLRLVRTAALTGHVFDESGEAVRSATVTLWHDDHSTGVGRIVRAWSDVVDDQGAFEFAPLNAGTYFVSAVATPWYAVHPPSIRQTGGPAALTSADGSQPDRPQVDRSVDVVYPTTYYAGATEMEDASPILVRGGDRLDLDLHLSPVPALHVILRAPFPQSGQGFQFPVILKRDLDGPQHALQFEVQTYQRGVVEIAVAPGKYELRTPQGNNEASRSSEVEITEDNQELDVSSGQALSKISAKVELIGGEAVMPPRMVFALRNAQHRIVARGVLSPAREVAFADVAPGNYEILAGSASYAYSVMSMVVNGTRVSGHSLTVPAGASLVLSLTVARGFGEVTGVAQQAGQPAAGAMMVLIPNDPESNSQLFRRDQSDLDGTFTFHGVLPGAYTVIAVKDGWSLDWSKPAVLTRYAAHGEKVVVGGSQSAIQLSKPVEIQPK